VSQYTQVPCPNCQRSLRVRKEYSDKVIACKYCDHAFHPKLPVPCPHCGETLNVRILYLGRRVTCKHCDHTFRAPPAEDAPATDAIAAADPGTVAALQVARLEAAAHEDQAQRLRSELAARGAEHDAAVADLGRVTEEAADLRAKADALQKQLDHARIDLEQASSLRQELDAARTSSKQLDARMKELLERTMEVEQLREQLSAAQTEVEQLRGEAQAAQQARADLEALGQEMSGLTTGHEQRLAALNADLDALRLAHEQSAAAALREWEDRHAATLGQMEEERAALHHEVDRTQQLWEARHRDALAGHEQRLNEEQTRAAEALRQWEERHAETERRLEEERALRREVDRTQQLWEARHRDALAGHEQRLNEEQTRAAEALRQWEERHAETERRLEEHRTTLRAEIERVHKEWQERHQAQSQEHQQTLAEQQREWQERHATAEGRLGEERAALHAQIEQIRAEAESLRNDRDQHVAHREETESRAGAEMARLMEEIERLGQTAAAAGQREQGLADQLRAIEVERQQALTALQAELTARQEAHAAALAERETRAAHDRQSLEAEWAAVRDLFQQDRARLEGEAERLRQEAEAVRAERDTMAAHRVHAEATAAGLTEQLQAVHTDADRRVEEVAALRSELEAARGEAAEARERAAHAAEEQARLAAGHAGWQEQLDQVRRQQDEERTGLHAEAERLRGERDSALGRADQVVADRDQVAAERDAAVAAHRELEQVVESVRAEGNRQAQQADALREALSAKERAAEAAATRSVAELEIDPAQVALFEQFEAARHQIADLTRERDQALAGWDTAARFVHETEARARGEMERLTVAFQQGQKELAVLARQQREAVRHAGELQSALDEQRQRAVVLARELDAARRSSDQEHADILGQLEALGELAAVRHELEAARSETAALREHAAHAAGGQSKWEQPLEGVRQQDDQEHAALRAEVERLRHESERLAAFAEVNVATRADEILRVQAEAAQALEQTRKQREAAEAARAVLAANLETVRAELADVQKRAASGAGGRDQLAALTQRFEQERTALLTEIDRLRREAESQAAVNLTPVPLPSYAEVSTRYGELVAQVEGLRDDLERFQGGGAGRGGRTGILGRLFGRSPEPSGPPAPAGLGRRLDSMRVEVAVDRERSLRTLIELEKVALQKQLDDALARLRLVEERDPQRHPGDDMNSQPFGAKSAPRPEDRVFLDPPASASQANRPNRPRRVEDLH
jgi:chromosome segregation ATPase